MAGDAWLRDAVSMMVTNRRASRATGVGKTWQQDNAWLLWLESWAGYQRRRNEVLN